MIWITWIILLVIFIVFLISYTIIDYYSEMKLETFDNTFFFLDKSDNTVLISKSKNVNFQKKQIERNKKSNIEILLIIPFDLEKKFHILFSDSWLGENYKKGNKWVNYSGKIKKFIKI